MNVILMEDCKRAFFGMTVVSFELEQAQEYLRVDTVLCIGNSILSTFFFQAIQFNRYSN